MDKTLYVLAYLLGAIMLPASMIFAACAYYGAAFAWTLGICLSIVFAVNLLIVVYLGIRSIFFLKFPIRIELLLEQASKRQDGFIEIL